MPPAINSETTKTLLNLPIIPPTQQQHHQFMNDIKPQSTTQQSSQRSTVPSSQTQQQIANNQTLYNNSEKSTTVIVFDWDDTLLSSSFLSSRGLRLDSDKSKVAEYENSLHDLEIAIVSVLQQALKYGQVHIVTNAETGWVQLSAQKFIPGVLPILQQISILSARSTYESRYPDSPLKWKFYAFQDKLMNVFNENTKKMKNILSFGDSHVEREAVRAVTRGFPNTRCKSVKFAERPTLEQLRRQLELVTNCFQYIHNHDGDLDLQLTVTINNNNNNQNNNNQKISNSLNIPSILQTSEEKPTNI
jgi:hypothetical protein